MLYTVVSGMLSVPDEEPSTSFDGSTSEAEEKADTTKRPTGDLSVDGGDGDVIEDEIVAKAPETLTVTTHAVADFAQVSKEKVARASIMSGASNLSGELPPSTYCVDSSGSVPEEEEVDASKPSTGKRLADGATDVDVIVKAPEVPSVTTRVADSARVLASKGRYVVVSGMNSLPGEALSGSSSGAVAVVSGDVHALDGSTPTGDRAGRTSDTVEKAPPVEGGAARGPEQQQLLPPLY